MVIQSRKLFPILLTAFLMGACGGGGGGSTTPPPVVNDPPPDPSGGITRTGVAFAAGPITGFGSVIVNGTRYDTSNAIFTKEGVPATQDDFAVGHNVVITGTIGDDNTNAEAETVEFNDNVEGEVTSVTDGPAGSDITTIIVVLEQTVNIEMGTSIDDSCPANLLNEVVEVSGSENGTGEITATRIECKSVLGEMEITGTVSNLQTGTMRFNINDLVVDYSTAAMDNFPGTISDGDPVEAKGVDFAAGVLTATRVEYKGALFDGAPGDHVEIEGFITDITSDTQFAVSGIPVIINGSTNFEGGDPADLNLNLKVEVEGEYDDEKRLVATKVEIKTSTAIRVTGALDSVLHGTDGSTLTILGITVHTTPLKTRFEDKTDVPETSISGLVGSHYVEIRGQEQPLGEITAMLVERDDPDPRTELRGFVTLKAEPELTVLNVKIVTDTETVYWDSRGSSEVTMTAGAFWAAVQEGSLVDARGTEIDTQILDATELELQLD